MLFIKDLNQDDSGDYICRGTYANNEEMESKVTIATFSKFLNYLKKILWELSKKRYS